MVKISASGATMLKYLAAFLISMIPVLELRGAIPFAVSMDIPYIPALIICTIGTNNRHQYHVDGPKRTYEQQRQRFYDNIFKLHGMLKDAGKDFILIANIPASASDELDGPTYWRIMHMNDIDELYKAAWAKLQFPFISLYDLFNDYCEENQRKVDSLLIDGLHPNDEGYDVMFALLTQALGV
jgi:lysophospholipase L1-like esterase